MRPLAPAPAFLAELPVLGREQVEQQPIVQPAVDHVALPLPSDEAEPEALEASQRRVAVHDPGVHRVQTELGEDEGQELRGREADVSPIGERLLPGYRPQRAGPGNPVDAVQADCRAIERLADAIDNGGCYSIDPDTVRAWWGWG